MKHKNTEIKSYDSFGNSFDVIYILEKQNQNWQLIFVYIGEMFA